MVNHEFPRAQRALAKLWLPSNDQPWNHSPVSRSMRYATW